MFNQGFPYNYVVAVDSKPFSAAPAPILDALQRLAWAGNKSVGDGTFQGFNELLAVGYFEEGKMNVSSIISISSCPPSTERLSSIMTMVKRS